MRYFAYGSNLNLPHLRQWLNRHDVPPDAVETPRHAILCDHHLRTNYFSSFHRAGACNVEPMAGRRVEGLLMEITCAARDAIRIKEGWPRRYEEVEVEVIISPHDQRINAITYAICPRERFPFDLPVTTEYRQLILEAAKEHALGDDYQDLLRRVLQPLNGARLPVFSSLTQEIIAGPSVI